MSDEAEFFVDTNVLLYSLGRTGVRKHQQAAAWVDALWKQRCARTSWQVVHEYYSNLIRKLRVDPKRARLEIIDLLEWSPIDTGSQLIVRAWHWCDRAQLNYWDALIVAAAEHTECRWLLSEDFQAGRKFGAVTVVNPFETQPGDFGLV
jgi:predicted nucleic acid-binding protein